MPPRSEWPRQLQRARVGAFVLIAIQFVALLVWCYVLARRFALTTDFSTFEQAVYLIAHGHLDPYSTTFGHPFWQDHGDFIAWPIALLQLLWPHPETLSWTQAAATVGAELAAIGWICDIAARVAHRDGARRFPAALVLVGAVLLATSPWVVWACSYDVHAEAFSALFVMLAGRDLFNGRRRAWIWIVLGLAAGDVSATYMAGLGLSAVITGRGFWRNGVAIAVLSIAWLALLGHIHGSLGTPIGQYASILGNNGTVPQSGSATSVAVALLTHPLRAITALWTNHINVWANVAPTGVVGWLWLPVLAPSAIVLLESGMAHDGNFALPGIQNLVLVPLSTVGIIGLCAACRFERSRTSRIVLCGLLGAAILNALIWTAIWLPRASATWLRVSPAAARVLTQARKQIPAGAEVVVSQGVAGGFAARPSLYLIATPKMSVPVATRSVWFVVTPRQGIELASVAAQYADIGQLAGTPNVQLVLRAAGVWVFRWTPAAGVKRFHLGVPRSVVPAFTVAGPSSIAVLTGPERDWHLATNGHSGYVVDHAYWRVNAGSYSATVSLAASTTATVEVWDDTTNTLLSRTTVPDTAGPIRVRSPVTVPPSTERLFGGWGIWRIAMTPPAGAQLEIRVWTPGGSDEVSVYSVGLSRARVH